MKIEATAALKEAEDAVMEMARMAREKAAAITDDDATALIVRRSLWIASAEAYKIAAAVIVAHRESVERMEKQ